MEIIVHRTSRESIQRYFDNLTQEIEVRQHLFSTRYASIAGTTVRIMCYDEALDKHICKEIPYILSNEADHFDYSFFVWLDSNLHTGDGEEHRIIENGKPVDCIPDILNNGTTGSVAGYDESSRSFYISFPSSLPEEMAKEGHIFAKQFYQVLKEQQNKSMVHGACVGIDGKGVLLCAKSNMGKSTLTVMSLLSGFEYIADDYLVIEKEKEQLYANPLYSIIALSPIMASEMSNELKGTEFVANNLDKSKYIISIANLHSSFRSDYPIKVCMFPEISSDSEPSISLCSAAEKGRAVMNMVVSTTIQVGDLGNNSASFAKLMELLKGYAYYKIRLCRDIRKNVECLRQFLLSLPE